MKKLFALFLISIMLLSSCADIDKSGAGGGDAPFDVLVITNRYPSKDLHYKSDEPPAEIDNIFQYWASTDVDLDEYLSSKPKAEFKVNSAQTKISFTPDLCGIIDNENKFKSLYESFSLGTYPPYDPENPDSQFIPEKYEDHFPKGFFDDCVILMIGYQSTVWELPFVSVDYTFDPNTNNLSFTFTERPHEGWVKRYTENLATYYYIVPIAKKDIIVDGKLVPYEKLNINVNYADW